MGLNSLKKHIFYEFLNLAGRVYVLARHSENVILGHRGFTSEEKENGIVLVFNSKMNFHWDDYGITATLVFGTSPQKCFIPVDDIIAVYSPDLSAQFVLNPNAARNTETQDLTDRKISAVPAHKASKEAKPSKNVIKVDFTRKTKTDD
ncbi:MAG: hypothetical protein EPN22_03560 [Nitrospirae bacterium]|nr:MAG: hypothetical protein EPN22_03560 [Nitrospirota bacterium]